MNTETTVNPATEGLGVVFYDASCALCLDWARRWERSLRRQGFRAIPLQTPGTAESLGVSPSDLLARMHLLTAGGRCFTGADAYVEMARARAWSRPLAWLAATPGVMPLLRRMYAAIAARRHCLSGACSVRKTGSNLRGAASVILSVVAALAPIPVFALQPHLPAWLFMWALAFTLFAACKWVTLQNAFRHGVALNGWAALGYLLAWVGMEPREFVKRGRELPDEKVTSGKCQMSNAQCPMANPHRLHIAHCSLLIWHWLNPRSNEALLLACAASRVLLGAALVWLGVRLVLPHSAIAAGWVGMVGIILQLHFGWFDLLAVAWRRAGYPVKTLMYHPTRAASVSEFWSVRWNRGFHALAHRFIFRPLNSRLGRPGAVMGVFAVSGLIHDLVITVPARGGYGLPTAYFLLQGLALILERSRIGRRFHLDNGIAGRLFALAIVVGPAFWLFPPVFVRNVILPMLHAIGAA